MTVQNGAAWWSAVERQNRVPAECTCVAMYAREAIVTWVIPCRRALPDLVAFVSFSIELGEVKMCLYACPLCNKMYKSWTNGGSSPKPEADSWRDHPKALQSCTHGFYRPTAAIDCHRPLFRHLKTSFAPWFNLGKSSWMRECIRNSTPCPLNLNQQGREAILLQDGGSHDLSWHFARGAYSMLNLSQLSNSPCLLDSWYHWTVHWICPSESLKNGRMVQNHEQQKHTSLAISMTCHSSDSRRQSRKRGMIWQSLLKTWHPLLALCLRGISAQRWLRQEQQGYTPK